MEHAQISSDDSLYAAHRAVLFDYALRRLGNVPDAESVVQEAFARTLRAQRQTVIEHPRAYLLRTVANLSTDLERSRARERHELIEAAAPEAQEQSDHQRVRDAVAGLPAPLRDVVALRYGDALSFSAIGRALSLSKNAVHHRHHRALAALRAILGLESPQ